LSHLPIFYAHTLCHAVKVVFDPMTLKICSTSVSGDQSLYKIEQIQQSPTE